MAEAVVEEKNFCSSCDRDIAIITDSVLFNCPNCGSKISRCGNCRGRGVTYTCRVCGFVGP